MENFERILRFLVIAINKCDRLLGAQFNENEAALDAFKEIYGEEKLQEELLNNKFLHLNAFYSPSWEFRKQVIEKSIPISLAKKYCEEIEAIHVRSYTIIHLVEIALRNCEIEQAVQLVEDLPITGMPFGQHIGYRKFLAFYAGVADYEKFRFYLKLSMPGKFPRAEIESCKRIFVSNFSNDFGLAKAIEMCRNKIFGIKYYLSAFKGCIESYSFEDIDNVLLNYPEVLEVDDAARARIYVAKLLKDPVKEIAKGRFDRVIDQLAKMEPSIKSGVMRLRDSLLIYLGSATSSKAQIEQCKRLMTSPVAKRELNFHMRKLGI